MFALLDVSTCSKGAVSAEGLLDAAMGNSLLYELLGGGAEQCRAAADVLSAVAAALDPPESELEAALEASTEGVAVESVSSEVAPVQAEVVEGTEDGGAATDALPQAAEPPPAPLAKLPPIPREAFLLALLPHVATLPSSPTSSAIQGLIQPPPQNFPEWPASQELNEQLEAYWAARSLLPRPHTLATNFVAVSASDSDGSGAAASALDVLGLLQTLVGSASRKRTQWLVLVRTNPLLAAVLGVPNEHCAKPQEEFDAQHAAFAPTPEGTTPDEEGNIPEVEVDPRTVFGYFSAVTYASASSEEAPAE